MIPINELQAKIYQCLNDLDIKVYDEVPLNSPMPLISIGDYNYPLWNKKAKVIYLIGL